MFPKRRVLLVAFLMATNNPVEIIIHHSLTSQKQNTDSAEKSFNEYHKSKGFPKSELGWYIGYHFVVYADGQVRRYKYDHEVGAHCKENNTNFHSVGICLQGDFDKEEPTEIQLEKTKDLLWKFINILGILRENIFGHRKYATYKSCPGKNIPDDLARYFGIIRSSEIPDWAQESVDKAIKNQIAIKWENPHQIVGNAVAEKIFINLKALSESKGELSKVRMIVALDRLGLLNNPK